MYGLIISVIYHQRVLWVTVEYSIPKSDFSIVQYHNVNRHCQKKFIPTGNSFSDSTKTIICRCREWRTDRLKKISILIFWQQSLNTLKFVEKAWHISVHFLDCDNQHISVCFRWSIVMYLLNTAHSSIIDMWSRIHFWECSPLHIKGGNIRKIQYAAMYIVQYKTELIVSECWWESKDMN